MPRSTRLSRTKSSSSAGVLTERMAPHVIPDQPLSDLLKHECHPAATGGRQPAQVAVQPRARPELGVQLRQQRRFSPPLVRSLSGDSGVATGQVIVTAAAFQAKVPSRQSKVRKTSVALQRTAARERSRPRKQPVTCTSLSSVSAEGNCPPCHPPQPSLSLTLIDLSVQRQTITRQTLSARCRTRRCLISGAVSGVRWLQKAIPR